MIVAVRSALPKDSTCDEEKLRGLPRKQVKERAFFGDWCDPVDRSLRVGDWRTPEGKELHNPKLKSLIGKGQGRHEGMSGAARGVVAGEGGQFAYAFSNPPTALRAAGHRVNSLISI